MPEALVDRWINSRARFVALEATHFTAGQILFLYLPYHSHRPSSKTQQRTAASGGSFSISITISRPGLRPCWPAWPSRAFRLAPECVSWHRAERCPSISWWSFLALCLCVSTIHSKIRYKFADPFCLCVLFPFLSYSSALPSPLHAVLSVCHFGAFPISSPDDGALIEIRNDERCASGRRWGRSTQAVVGKQTTRSGRESINGTLMGFHVDTSQLGSLGSCDDASW